MSPVVLPASIARDRLRCGLSVAIALGLATVRAFAQPAPAPPATSDTRTQLPSFLQQAYVGLDIGLLGYTFSDEQLLPGHRSGAIHVPRAAFGVALFGHRFDRRLAAQMTYVRPVKYVRYVDVNGARSSDSVWMTYAAFTAKFNAEVQPGTSLYAEGGFGITNRRGFALGGAQVMTHALFPMLVFGGGLEHQLRPSWDLTARFIYFPSHAPTRQPRAVFLSGGIRYNLQMVPPDRVAANANSGFAFPEHTVSVGYTTSTMGYGANNVLSRQVAIFWGGKINVRSGAAVHYQRNVFHSRKRFAIDIGASLSRFESAGDKDLFTTLALYPQVRFVPFRGTRADLYIFYSVAGPTFVSRKVIDGRETGRYRFTFQDTLGAGMYLGPSKRVLLGIRLSHYSNGNLLGINPGIAVPMTFELGYAFN